LIFSYLFGVDVGLGGGWVQVKDLNSRIIIKNQKRQKNKQQNP